MCSDDKTLLTASGGVWQDSRNNPDMPRSCGIDAALLLDLSSSVGSELPFLKQAANTFVNSLTGTPSRIAVFSFSGESPSTGTENHPALTSVATSAGADTVKNIYANWQLGAGTNWDQALYAPATASPHYDALVMITDGNPTYYGNPRQGTSSYTTLRDTENGIFSANALKAKGTRVVALGVGKGVEGVSGLNLRAISGPVAYDGTNPTTADYFQTTDYSGASEALHEIALDHCDGSLTVIKQIVPAGNTGEDVAGSENAGAGWTFNASATTDSTLGSQTTTDDGTGTVGFRPTFTTATSAGVTVNEIQHDRYTLVTQDGKNAVCKNLDTGADAAVTNSGGTGFTVNVPATAAISCTVYNRPAEHTAVPGHRDRKEHKKRPTKAERSAARELPVTGGVLAAPVAAAALALLLIGAGMIGLARWASAR